MNERIRELMDQAGELAYEEHKAKCLKNGLDPMMPFGNNLMAILEKFAELIVAECIFVMKSTVDESIDFDRKLDETSSWIESDIKKHFGVEE